jgi:hypothetical protein
MENLFNIWIWTQKNNIMKHLFFILFLFSISCTSKYSSENSTMSDSAFQDELFIMQDSVALMILDSYQIKQEEIKQEKINEPILDTTRTHRTVKSKDVQIKELQNQKMKMDSILDVKSKR